MERMIVGVCVCAIIEREREREGLGHELFFIRER